MNNMGHKWELSMEEWFPFGVREDAVTEDN